MEFNQRLREIRISKDYKQRDIYTILKVSANCYASWEQGRTEPDIYNIKRLCAIFDVSADYLLGIEDETGAKYTHSFNGSFNGNSGNIEFKVK